MSRQLAISTSWASTGTRMSRVVLVLYAALLRLATPLYLMRVWSRGRVEPDYRAQWWERLGLYGRAYRACVVASAQHPGPLIWVHAVSLGETRAAAALIQALRASCPGMRLLLTHSTATGRAAGQALVDAQRGDLQTWFPFDTPGSVRRFLSLHRPAVGVLMETEIWPMLQHQARAAGLPMVLANARLSERSLRRGQRFAALLRPAAQALCLVLAQTQHDARRLLSLLVPGGQAESVRPQVQVCGNIKFDMTPAPQLLALGRQWQGAALPGEAPRPVVLAASTREGEEPGLLVSWSEAMRNWQGAGDRPRLCIVPRHPQRFAKVAALAEGAGLSLSRRSTWPKGQPDTCALAADVWLGDSMGEMPAYYTLARVALLGGSFAPLGGHNLIEAAACACPLVTGPSTFNFAEAAELSRRAGVTRPVADVHAGVREALAWLADPVWPQDVQRCVAFAQAHRGAAARSAQLILDLHISATFQSHRC